MEVRGEHTLETTETGTQVTNRFTVDGRLPGVERYFKQKLDDELASLKVSIKSELGI
jgi:hypothetical protein